MTDPGPDALEERRRKLNYRMWHRGTREMDLILGRFADAHVAALSEADIAELERLADMPDPILYGWIVGGEPAPAESEGAILGRLRDFHTAKARE